MAEAARVARRYFPILYVRSTSAFLVGAVGSRLAGGLVDPARLLRRLGFLAGFARAFRLRRIGLRPTVVFDCVFDYWFLLDRVAVVTSITPVGKNSKQNLSAITYEANDGWA